MSMSLAAPVASQAFTRRNIIVAVMLIVAAVVGFGIATRPDIANLVGNRLGDAANQSIKSGVQAIKSVAAMMAERSPGERAKGALASLKNKRPTGVHERALPKVRRPLTPPVSPLASIVAAPPPTPVLPPAAPLYNLMAGPPTPVTPVPGTTGGGSVPPLAEIPTPGGGGGIIGPPTTTTEVPPSTPPSAVPEPNSWALMLLGFGLIGAALRRDRRRPALVATE